MELKPNYYMVLGVKGNPVDCNNYGIENEKDNPLLISTLEFARQVAEKVNEFERSDKGYFAPCPDFKAEIVELFVVN